MIQSKKMINLDKQTNKNSKWNVKKFWDTVKDQNYE